MNCARAARDLQNAQLLTRPIIALGKTSQESHLVAPAPDRVLMISSLTGTDPTAIR